MLAHSLYGAQHSTAYLYPTPSTPLAPSCKNFSLSGCAQTQWELWLHARLLVPSQCPLNRVICQSAQMDHDLEFAGYAQHCCSSYMAVTNLPPKLSGIQR